MSVSHILKSKGRDVITAKAQDHLHDIAHTLASKRIGAIVILSANGKIEGIEVKGRFFAIQIGSGKENADRTFADGAAQELVEMAEVGAWNIDPRHVGLIARGRCRGALGGFDRGE